MKLKIGDSIKFKDGRQGTVEKEDNKFFYIKDTNDKVVKLKKDASPFEEAINEFYRNDLKPMIEKGLQLVKDKFRDFLEDEEDVIDLDNFDKVTVAEDFSKFIDFYRSLTFNFGDEGIDIHIFSDLNMESFRPFEGKVGIVYSFDYDFKEGEEKYLTDLIEADFNADSTKTKTDIFIKAAEFRVPVKVKFVVSELDFYEE